jgi:glycosyltransferase involved in cell wall biosynthesis
VRVLWVKAGKLLPVDTGGKIRSYNLLRQIAATHELVFLSYYGDQRDATYEEDIARQLPGAETIYTGQPGRSRWHYARHLLSAVPYAVAKFTSARVRGVVGEWLQEQRFDVAVCDFLSASLNFPASSPTPCVLFEHNVESILWRRQARHEPNPLKRMAFTIEAIKMAAYERAAVRRFSHVIAVSNHDREALAAMVDRSSISVVPTGVDVSKYRAAAGVPADRPLVLFLGSMDWEANVDAVDYFCRDIWPAVRAAVPGARFRIVGRNPPARVRSLASDSIEVTGTVPSVVDYLKEAAVFVVPLRVGGGTRLKIFEAMAAGRAVVSTSIGAEGLDVTDGRDIVLADTASDFGHAVIELLRNPVRRRAFELAAAESAARHDWPAIAADFAGILARATVSCPSAPVAVRQARVSA